MFACKCGSVVDQEVYHNLVQLRGLFCWGYATELVSPKSIQAAIKPREQVKSGMDMKILVLTLAMAAAREIVLRAAKEAVVVQTSYAGCCGQPAAKCPECHVEVHGTLKVGNYHYRGDALLAFDLTGIAAQSCAMSLPAGKILSLGGTSLNIHRSLAADFDAAAVTWNSAPGRGERVVSFDIRGGSVDLSPLCREAGGGLLTFFVTPGPFCSVDLPSSSSDSPLELHVLV